MTLKKVLLFLYLFCFLYSFTYSQKGVNKLEQSLYDFTMKNIDGVDVNFGDYKDKVILIVNVASNCGFTPQYEGLQKLYKNYKDKGLVVLGFPCNQFGLQEPGDENEIKDFCSLTYNVTFPMFSKIEVNGLNTAPLFKYLKKNYKGNLKNDDIRWNFTKYLINRNGEITNRFEPQTTPEDIEKDIIELLNK